MLVQLTAVLTLLTFLYAVLSGVTLYALTRDEDRDLPPIIIDRPVKTSALHLTSQEPTNRALCPKCAECHAAQRLVATLTSDNRNPARQTT